MTALDIAGLSAHAGDLPLLQNITLSLEPGRVLVVLGASGAGKTTLGLAATGRTRPGVRLTGSVRFQGPVGHLPQQPSAVLDPVRRCGPVLRELAGLRGQGRAAAVAALEDAGLDARLWRRFPHQLSGGQQQRMALATALVIRPALLVLDEPTTGLDPAARAALTGRLAALARAGTALLVLTHDLALARALADDVAVLDEGRVVATGLDAITAGATPPPAPPAPAAEPVLVVRGLTVRAGRVPLLEDVDLDLAAGSRTALAGVSGAGKTTLARALAGLTRPSAGTITVDGVPLPARRKRPHLRAVQYVHQDSRASFDEFRGVLDQVADTAHRLRGLDRPAARDEALELLRELGIADADRRPGRLSGGQLQRCALARALLARPRVLICDEATSALDAATRRRVLEVLTTTAAAHATALLLISHDPTRVTDRTITLANGRL